MGMRNQQWPWFAILARTGRERNATLLLENAGYECYLPVSKFIRRWSDRLRGRCTPVSRVPILPDEPAQSASCLDDAGGDPDRWGRKDTYSGGRARNCGDPAGGQERSPDNALAVLGSGPRSSD